MSQVRSTPKRTAAIATAAVVTLAAGPVASGAPDGDSNTQHPVTGSLHNTCDFPKAGAQPVTAGITATFPISVPPGKPVQGTEVSAKLVLPEPTVTALADAGVVSVEGIAHLDVPATYLGETTPAQARLGIIARPLPANGELQVEGRGEMDAVPTARPGDMVLRLGPPELALLLRTADGSLISDDPVAVVSCTAEAGQDTALTTVRVAPPAEDTTTPPPPGTSAPGGSDSPTTESGSAPPHADGARTEDEEDPGPCGAEIPDDAILTKRGFYNVVATTTVKKLDSEVVFGPPGYLGGDVWIWLRNDPETGTRLFCNGIRGDLLLPATRGSFTLFRFVPATSLIDVLPVGPAEGAIDPHTQDFTGQAITDMRLRDVRVNGTPFDVGPNCGTGTPIKIDLAAKQTEWNLATGGVMEADFTIPEFGTCGVTESLDPLFTNLVSGPGNHIRLEFSGIKDCTIPDPPPVCEQSAGR